MYRTQHNDGGEGEAGKRRRGEREGDKEGVEEKKRKEEERERTVGERKITFYRVRGREKKRVMASERGREVGRKRVEESEGGR